MRSLQCFLILIITVAFAGSGFAVPTGKTVEFSDGAQGKVIFGGTTHADKGLKCKDCHPKIFPMKKTPEKINMSEINGGKYCGECHNGEKAFATNSAANCSKCHKK
jgi:c(7)-type cytochrome triheme protein